MWIPDIVLKFFGRKVADKLDLKEDKEMESKPWYQSKSIWTSVVVGLIGIYGTLQATKGWPPIPEWVYTILAAVGVYSRVSADTKIGS